MRRTDSRSGRVCVAVPVPAFLAGVCACPFDARATVHRGGPTVDAARRGSTAEHAT